nr:hypothetical protein [Candidatus Woesearchaeota archaeon]
MSITDILGFQGYIVLILFVIALIMLYRIKTLNLDRHIRTGILGILLLLSIPFIVRIGYFYLENEYLLYLYKISELVIIIALTFRIIYTYRENTVRGEKEIEGIIKGENVLLEDDTSSMLLPEIQRIKNERERIDKERNTLEKMKLENKEFFEELNKI